MQPSINFEIARILIEERAGEASRMRQVRCPRHERVPRRPLQLLGLPIGPKALTRAEIAINQRSRG